VLTNLFNRTQPIIRYELSDMVAIDSRPCACGRSLRRVVAMEGRSNEILRFPAPGGGEVAVHPFVLESPFTRLPEVRQYKIVHDGGVLRVLAVPREGVGREAIVQRVGDALTASLVAAGASPPAIHVEVVATLARDQGHGAKFKLIESGSGATRSARTP